MPTLYKTINLNISDVERVPANFVLKTVCPKCGVRISRNFQTIPIKYPKEKQTHLIKLACAGCHARFKMPVKVINIRMVLTYDVQLLKELDD
jgi:hypothetical protein